MTEIIPSKSVETLDINNLTSINVTSPHFDSTNYMNIGKKVVQNTQQTYQQSNQQSYNQNYTQQTQPNYTSQQPQTSQVRHQRPIGNGKRLIASSREALTSRDLTFGISYDIKDNRCCVEISTFALDASGKCLGDDWFIFYGNEKSTDGSISYHEDDMHKASGIYDDKIVDININRLNTSVKKIAIVLTIDEALEKGLRISMLNNVTLSCKDKQTGTELFNFTLEKYSNELTAVSLAEIYEHNGQWKIRIIGEGVKRDLAGLCEFYGIEVSD